MLRDPPSLPRRIVRRGKRTIASAFYSTGILALLAQYKLARASVVLMYHRVIPHSDTSDFITEPGMYVTPDTFESHVRYLNDNYTVVPLAELTTRLKQHKSISRLCSITFDDGWHDNYQFVFPVLKKYNLPATVFLAAGFVGTTYSFWPTEVLHFLRSDEAAKDIVLQLGVSHKDITKNYSSDSAHFDPSAVINHLKTLNTSHRNDILERLRAKHSIRLPTRDFMTWDEVHEMGMSGLVTYGAHTVNHVLLDQVNTDEAKREICESKRIIETATADRVTHFAYPNGNFNRCTVEIIRESGFAAAVTVRKGLVTAGDCPYSLHRIGVHQDVTYTRPLFATRILLDHF